MIKMNLIKAKRKQELIKAKRKQELPQKIEIEKGHPSRAKQALKGLEHPQTPSSGLPYPSFNHCRI